MDINLFEVSFEVANKIGGIHTFLSSKTKKMVDIFKDYYFIGPYNLKRVRIEFEEKRAPNEFKPIFQDMKNHGINCYYGNWLVPGRPKAILVEPTDYKKQINKIKEHLWDEYQVDSWGTDFWFNQPVLWSKAAGILLEKMIQQVFNDKPCVVHSHEWLSGPTLLHLHEKDVDAGTVFTTHATVLGRTMAGNGVNIHDMINKGLSKGKCVDEQACYSHRVCAKHHLERAVAKNAKVFTTVSDVMSKEAEFFLGRRPDVVCPNGLDTSSFPLMEELSVQHKDYREQLRHFTLAYIAPYYNIDVKKTLFFFTAGRHEMKVKGIDMFIDALGRMNKELSGKTDRNLVAFIWVPGGNDGPRKEFLETLALFNSMEEYVEDHLPKFGESLLQKLCSGKVSSTRLSDDFKSDCKKMILRFKNRKGNPPVCSHIIDRNDIIEALEKNGLGNSKEDVVKVIYYPEYLSSADLIGLNLYPALIGSHFGIFPSFYEPWGYTPLETMSCGVPTVTSDVSGFGKFIEPQLMKNSGVYIIPREKESYEQGVKELANVMKEMLLSSRTKRIEQKMNAKKLSKKADWSKLIKNYLEAYQLASS